MELRTLGPQGPAISVVGYGGWEAGGRGWGAPRLDAEVIAAMRAGFDAGINWIDTAEVYGDGGSEELSGRAIQGHDDVMVFTKVASAPRGSGYARASIRRAAEASLRRLRRDVIDVYQLHWPDEKDVPLEEAWGSMATLVESGLVRWIGVSNFTEDLIARCEAIRHVDVLQPHLSMLWQERLPLTEVCVANGTGVIVYGPLAFGLLTGTITPRTRFADDDFRGGKLGLRAYNQLFSPGRFEANLGVVSAVTPIAARIGVSLAQLAIAWVLHRQGVSGAIVGSCSPQHVRENVAASSARLSARDLADIGRVLQRRSEVLLPLAP